MARLFADEDFDYAVVQQLRALGHDVRTVQEAGKTGEADAGVLSFAVANGRAVITHNRRHFVNLHRRGGKHSGIIVCTRDSDAIALAGRVHQSIAKLASLDDQLIRINRPRSP